MGTRGREQRYIEDNKKTPATLDTKLFESGIVMSPGYYQKLKYERPTPQYVADAFARRERLLNANPKFTDVVGNFTADLTTAVSDPIFINMTGLMQRGYNSYQQFIGDQIEPIYNTLRFIFTNPTDSATQGINIWLFQYKGPVTTGANGIITSPSPSAFVNIYQKPTGGIDPISYMLGGKNFYNAKLIKTIWRRWYSCNAKRTGGFEVMIDEIQADLIDKCRPIRFQDATVGSNIYPIDGTLILMIQDSRGATTVKTATTAIISNRLVYGQ